MATGASTNVFRFSDFYFPKGLALLVSRRGANASNAHVLIVQRKGRDQNVPTEGLQRRRRLDLPQVSMTGVYWHWFDSNVRRQILPHQVVPRIRPQRQSRRKITTLYRHRMTQDGSPLPLPQHRRHLSYLPTRCIPSSSMSWFPLRMTIIYTQIPGQVTKLRRFRHRL